MTARERQIYTQVRLMATDADLVRIFNLKPADLERYRAIIDRGRTEMLVILRHKRAEATAGRAKGKGE